MVTMSELCDDLAAEHDSLDDLVADLDPAGWDRPTPAPGWSVRDQIGHLAFFDEQATRAIADPEGFRAALESIAQDVAGFIQLPLDRGRAMDPHEVLTWWRTARSELLDAARPLEPKTRIA